MQFDNIFLIGMMGAGKSTVGELLSQKIKLPLLDIDKEIEKIMDMPISQIFSDYGEKRFRLIESTFFKECTKLNNYIYATGGGIILDKNNQSIIRNRGITFFLDCDIEIITHRIKDTIDDRPLLPNNFQKELKILFKNRYSLYKSNSKHTINSSSINPSQIVNKIEDYLHA